MTTTTYIKLKEEIKKELFQEISDFLVRDTNDPEGEYRPEFVKKILKVARERKRFHRYSPKTFSKLIS